MNKRQKKKLEGRTGSVFGVKVVLTLTEARKARKLKHGDKVMFLCEKAHEKTARAKK